MAMDLMDLMRITEAPDSIAVTGDLYNFFVNDNGNLKQVDKDVLRTYFNNGANTWNNLLNKPFTTLNTEQFNVLAGVMSINGYHTHDNIEILNKFALDESGSLVYDGSPIGEYTLPVAKEDTLGGVKPDGTTIKVDEDGTIHGASTYILPTASTDTLGGVMIDGDTIKSNNGGVISADVIGNWSAGINYPIGYFVVYGEGIWECMVAHTSGSAFDESKWIPVAFRAIKVYNWSANTDYYLYQLVIYNNTLYRAKEKHTSGSTFDESKWELISGGTTGTTINGWSASTDYAVGDLIINETTLYQCNTEHTSGDTFDETESVNWTALSGVQGEKGDDGYSPTANVTQTDTGCTVTVIDTNGTTTANLINGTDGKDGVDGTTPTIDETTKHWMIGDTDTGIVAEGTTTISTTSITYTGTLTTSGWSDSSPYIQTVNISGITADIEPIIDLVVSDDVTTSDEEIAQWSYITKAVTENNAITFRCNKTKPTIELNFKIKVV